MQIFLHLLDGSQSVVEVDQSTSLEVVLSQLDSSCCRVVYQGNHIVSLESVENNANLYLTSDLDGGKKKKKKKVYTTKKKNKHIHKRVKNSFENLYKVDGTYSFIQARELSLKPERPALHVVQEPIWLNTGIDTIVDSATLPLRWTLRPSKRTKKSWKRRKLLLRLRRRLRRKKLLIKPLLVRERRTLRRELQRRNDS